MYYQSSARPNDPSEPDSDRLKTLLDNLNNLRGKLKNFTVIDELGQPIGEISDLILDAGHQLNLVIAQPDDRDRQSSVLLNGRRIKKVSVQTQSVFVDITKADAHLLPEYLLPEEAPLVAPPVAQTDPLSPLQPPEREVMAAPAAATPDFSLDVMEASVEPASTTYDDDLSFEPAQTPEAHDWNRREDEVLADLPAAAASLDFPEPQTASTDSFAEDLDDLSTLELSNEARSLDEFAFLGNDSTAIADVDAEPGLTLDAAISPLTLDALPDLSVDQEAPPANEMDEWDEFDRIMAVPPASMDTADALTAAPEDFTLAGPTTPDTVDDHPLPESFTLVDESTPDLDLPDVDNLTLEEQVNALPEAPLGTSDNLATFDFTTAATDLPELNFDAPEAQANALPELGFDEPQLFVDDLPELNFDEPNASAMNLSELSFEDAEPPTTDLPELSFEEAATSAMDLSDLSFDESEPQTTELPELMFEAADTQEAADTPIDLPELSFEEAATPVMDLSDLSFDESESQTTDPPELTFEDAEPEAIALPELTFDESSRLGDFEFSSDTSLADPDRTPADRLPDLNLAMQLDELAPESGFPADETLPEITPEEAIAAEWAAFDQEMGLSVENSGLESDDLSQPAPRTEFDTLEFEERQDPSMSYGLVGDADELAFMEDGEESESDLNTISSLADLDFTAETPVALDVADGDTLASETGDESFDFGSDAALDLDLPSLDENLTTPESELDSLDLQPEAEPDDVFAAAATDAIAFDLETTPTSDFDLALSEEAPPAFTLDQGDELTSSLDLELPDSAETAIDFNLDEPTSLDSDNANSSADFDSQRPELPPLNLDELELSSAPLGLPTVESSFVVEPPPLAEELGVLDTAQTAPESEFGLASIPAQTFDLLGDNLASGDLSAGSEITASETTLPIDAIDAIVPLLEERLKVEYERRKVGEVIIRKQIETRMVQVPVRYEKLVIEQVGDTSKTLAEVDLSQGMLDTVDVGASGKPVVSGEFKSPKTASYVLDAIAKTLQHRCKKVRIEIELEDPKLQQAYQDWLNQCSQM
ncbi:MAG: DUF2382 domain-containing protein [Leptolyngbyaceae cyanobacterium bins.349]|nr:DUF2382 domain-containing protein [Leptolyngbyaceae cyanobacterium bins.349]